jgi:hypothetical protein
VLQVVVVMFAAGTATIAALTPVTLHELAQDDLAQILEGGRRWRTNTDARWRGDEPPDAARRTMPSLITASHRTA